MALSPDGRMLAFTAVSDGINSIWVRPLDALQARPLRQARPTQPFFWSFDSRFIAYNGEGKLTKIDVTGGPPQVVCDAPHGVVGGFWTKDNRIVFGQSPGPLMTVPASGGVPTPVAALDSSRSITNQVMPSLLPDGRHMVVYTGYQSNNGVFLTSFDARPGSEKFLLDAPVGAIFAASPDCTSGYLLFLRDSTLLAQPFDVANLALAGTAVPVAEGVGTYLAHGYFSIANNGVLAYRTGSSGGLRLAWFDRSGKETGSVGPPGDYRALALSPDGARVATSRTDARNMDIWLFDLERNTNTRLTSDPLSDSAPVWSRDGSRVAWASGAGSEITRGLFMTPAAGDATPEMLLPPAPALSPWDWSGDGRILLYSAADPKTTKSHLWILPVERRRESPPPLRKPNSSKRRPNFRPTAAGFPTRPISPEGMRSMFVRSLRLRNRVERSRFPGAEAPAPAGAGTVKNCSISPATRR